MGITDESQWNQVFFEKLQTSQGVYLQPVKLLREFYRHTIRITVEADSIPINWHRAGYLIHNLRPPNEKPFIVESLPVFLNQTQLLELRNVSDRFYLEFNPLRRYLWLTVKIEFYEGGV